MNDENGLQGRLHPGLPPQLAPVMTLDWPQVAQSAWRRHAPFTGWLIDALRPRTLVELGTHWGFSYFVMCTAAKSLGHPMQAFAVDHWLGDEHAGEFGEEVFGFVDSLNRESFDGWSTLLRTDFDSAVTSFEPESVDLLHIDGFHTYDAVKHDFTTWQHTLSDRSVVLFHDVREYQEGFGVHRYWDELRRSYPSFTFPFGHGLGVLAVGPNVPSRVLELCASDTSEVGDRTRWQFQALGEGVEIRHERNQLRLQLTAAHEVTGVLQNEIQRLTAHIGALQADRDQIADQVAALEAQQVAFMGQEAALQGQLAALGQEIERLQADRDASRSDLGQIISSKRWRTLDRLLKPLDQIRADSR